MVRGGPAGIPRGLTSYSNKVSASQRSNASGDHLLSITSIRETSRPVYIPARRAVTGR